MAKLFSEKPSARKLEAGSVKPVNGTKPGFLSFLQRNPSMAAAGTLGLLAAGVLVVLNVNQPQPDSTGLQVSSVDEGDVRQNLTASAKGDGLPNPIKEALEKKPEQDSAALLEQIFKKSTQGGAQQQQPASTNAAGGEKLLELLRQSAQNKSSQQAPSGPIGLKGSLIVYLDGPGSSKAKSETSTNEAALKLFQSAGIVDATDAESAPAQAAGSQEEAPAEPLADPAAEGKLPEPVSIAVRSMPIDSAMQVVSPQLLTKDIVPGVDMVRMAQGGFGKVLLKVSVDAEGQVTSVEEGQETRVSAEGRRQLDTLKAAIAGWKFRPSRVGASNVAFTLDLHMPPAQ